MTGEELAALALALRLTAAEPVAIGSSAGTAAWSLAGRLPELEIDDLRGLLRSDTCSPRF